MKAVGLIAAMPQEIAPFLRRVGRYERFSLGAFSAYRFRQFELDCVLVRCGVGLERAMSASRALILAARPDVLVSFGVAGTVRPGPQVGDVVSAAGVCLLKDAADADSYLPLAELSLQAQKLISEALQPRRARLFSGFILTTPGSQELPALPAQVANPLLDMETAGVAQVAGENSVPLLGLRAVSDSVDQPLPFDPAKFYDEQQNLRVGRLIAAMIRRPHMLAQSMRFSQNVKRASENLAVALFEALKHADMLEIQSGLPPAK
jgi:adenosylhomocysteine nucleosidase